MLYKSTVLRIVSKFSFLFFKFRIVLLHFNLDFCCETMKPVQTVNSNNKLNHRILYSFKRICPLTIWFCEIVQISSSKSFKSTNCIMRNNHHHHQQHQYSSNHSNYNQNHSPTFERTSKSVSLFVYLFIYFDLNLCL